MISKHENDRYSPGQQPCGFLRRHCQCRVLNEADHRRASGRDRHDDGQPANHPAPIAPALAARESAYP